MLDPLTPLKMTLQGFAAVSLLFLKHRKPKGYFVPLATSSLRSCWPAPWTHHILKQSPLRLSLPIAEWARWGGGRCWAFCQFLLKPSKQSVEDKGMRPHNSAVGKCFLTPQLQALSVVPIVLHTHPHCWCFLRFSPPSSPTPSKLET